jgi:transposase
MAYALSRAHLDEVAHVYGHAAELGWAPNVTIAETFEVSTSTAARWVAMAREQGVLPPVRQGHHSHRQARLVRAAAALGVEYDRLCEVIQAEGGRLTYDR